MIKIFQDLTDWTAFRNSSHFLNKRVTYNGRASRRSPFALSPKSIGK